jgi:hypothetical protein
MQIPRAQGSSDSSRHSTPVRHSDERACEFIDSRWIESVASFDFAQDEEYLDVPSTVYLILSAVEGRTIDMQRLSQPSVDKFISSKTGTHRSDAAAAEAWIPDRARACPG